MSTLPSIPKHANIGPNQRRKRVRSGVLALALGICLTIGLIF